ncbi:hypothetical protein BV25DRAFT_1779587, partial [Artomyces pyxidatus]
AATAKIASRKQSRRVFKPIAEIACYFCRRRKIACECLSGSRSCLQCVKRGLACIYPTQSRRGQ